MPGVGVGVVSEPEPEPEPVRRPHLLPRLHISEGVRFLTPARELIRFSVCR